MSSLRGGADTGSAGLSSAELMASRVKGREGNLVEAAEDVYRYITYALYMLETKIAELR